MTLVCVFIVGVLVGCIFGVIGTRIKSIGALRIDYSDPDGPYLFLEAQVHPELLRRKKYVTMKVKNENFISRQ